jgi:hypothetical protein
MTIERPMFPPVDPTRRHFLSVVGGIDFTSSAPDERHIAARQAYAKAAAWEAMAGSQGLPPAESSSTTAQNGRLRKERYETWRMAEVVTRYWRTRLDFHDALSSVQRRGISEGRCHPAVNGEDRRALVDKWRAAFVKQLLTPASDAASVAWKQNALARGKYEYSGLKPERLKHVIAEDLAFLAAHPVRQSNRRSVKDSTLAPMQDG